jgi:hypothetical protein
MEMPSCGLREEAPPRPFWSAEHGMAVAPDEIRGERGRAAAAATGQLHRQRVSEGAEEEEDDLPFCRGRKVSEAKMLADVYVLANERSAALVERFLDRFLPERAPARPEYEVPQYADPPEVVLHDAAELLRLCEARPRLRYAVYWNNTSPGGEPRAAHAFFLADGGLVLGLSIWHEPLRQAYRLLHELRAFAGNESGYVTCEQPPAESSDEFRRPGGGK